MNVPHFLQTENTTRNENPPFLSKSPGRAAESHVSRLTQQSRQYDVGYYHLTHHKATATMGSTPRPDSSSGMAFDELYSLSDTVSFIIFITASFLCRRELRSF